MADIHETMDASTPLLSRRRMFTLAGAGALGTAAALGTLPFKSPQVVQAATTTGTFYDQGGAVFNVKAYGALGNGTTDDTVAIQSTINAAKSSGGGIVFLPTGNYLLTNAVTVDSPGISIVGAGQSATTIIVSNSYLNGNVLSYQNISTLNANQSAGSINSLRIVSQLPRSGGAAINLDNVSNISIQDVDMVAQYIGILITGTGVLHHINRGYYLNFASGGTGIWVNSRNTNDTFVNHIIMDTVNTAATSQPRAGLRITQTQAVWAHACDFLHAQDGLLIDTPAGGLITWCFFSDCAWDSCASRCMLIDPASGAEVNGLTFVNCWSSSAAMFDGCYVGGPVDGCEFIGHRFIANQGNGLYVANPATNVHVDACIATGNRSGHGFIFSGASNFAVRNSHSGPYGGRSGQGYGIRAEAGCANYVITGNILIGNTTPLQDNGGPNKVVANNLM